ncbi:MAG: histidine kinase N-terminal 7TM domain-containing protein [bacterium]
MILPNIILFISIANFILTGFIFLNAKKEKQHISFLVFSLITTIWLFNNFLLISDFHSVYPLSYGLGILVVTSVSIWICYFLKEQLPKIAVFFIIPFSVLVFFVSSFTNYVVGPIEGVTPLGYKGEAGALFSVYSAYMGFLIVFSLYKLLRGFLEERNALKKKQIMFVFAGAVASGLLAFGINFFIPLIWNTFEFIKLVNLAFFPLLIAIIYSTAKHQLFGIKIMTTQLLVVLFLSLLLLNFLFSNSYGQYIWSGILLVVSALLSYLIMKSMFKEIDFDKKLLVETQKNLDFEKRLRKIYAEIAEKEIKSKYFRE